MNDFVIQTLKKDFREEIKKATMYYALLSVWSNLGLTERKIQLLAFTAIRGTISSPSSKEEFSRLYGSSSATINNIISELREMGLLIKSNGKYKVNDKINLDFSKDLLIGFKLLNSSGNGK